MSDYDLYLALPVYYPENNLNLLKYLNAVLSKIVIQANSCYIAKVLDSQSEAAIADIELIRSPTSSRF